MVVLGWGRKNLKGITRQWEKNNDSEKKVPRNFSGKFLSLYMHDRPTVMATFCHFVIPVTRRFPWMILTKDTKKSPPFKSRIHVDLQAANHSTYLITPNVPRSSLLVKSRRVFFQISMSNTYHAHAHTHTYPMYIYIFMYSGDRRICLRALAAG